MLSDNFQGIKFSLPLVIRTVFMLPRLLSKTWKFTCPLGMDVSISLVTAYKFILSYPIFILKHPLKIGLGNAKTSICSVNYSIISAHKDLMSKKLLFQTCLLKVEHSCLINKHDGSCFEENKNAI